MVYGNQVAMKLILFIIYHGSFVESEAGKGVFAHPGRLSSNPGCPHDLLSTLNCKTSLVFLQDLLVNEPMLSHLLKCMYPLKPEEAPVSSV